MPISKANRARYPLNWKAIRGAILSRARYRCECVGECGLHTTTGRCTEMDRTPARWANGRVVLTVAHLNHTPEDCRRENLKAMCQRCHLRYDRELHAENSAKTRALSRPPHNPQGAECLTSLA